MNETNENIGLAPVPEELTVSDVYGTIINNQKPAETEWDTKTKELETPVTVTMKLPTSFVARLQRVADDSGKTLDQWVTTCVTEAIDGKVGAAVIKGPSFAKGGKVTGPKGTVKRA